jgi:hypothetical protein
MNDEMKKAGIQRIEVKRVEKWNRYSVRERMPFRPSNLLTVLTLQPVFVVTR